MSETLIPPPPETRPVGARGGLGLAALKGWARKDTALPGDTVTRGQIVAPIPTPQPLQWSTTTLDPARSQANPPGSKVRDERGLSIFSWTVSAWQPGASIPPAGVAREGHQT